MGTVYVFNKQAVTESYVVLSHTGPECLWTASHPSECPRHQVRGPEPRGPPALSATRVCGQLHLQHLHVSLDVTRGALVRATRPNGALCHRRRRQRPLGGPPRHLLWASAARPRGLQLVRGGAHAPHAPYVDPKPNSSAVTSAALPAAEAHIQAARVDSVVAARAPIRSSNDRTGHRLPRCFCP